MIIVDTNSTYELLDSLFFNCSSSQIWDFLNFEMWALFSMAASADGSSFENYEEAGKLVKVAARDCMPPESGSIIEFQSRTGVEVCFMISCSAKFAYMKSIKSGQRKSLNQPLHTACTNLGHTDSSLVFHLSKVR